MEDNLNSLDGFDSGNLPPDVRALKKIQAQFEFMAGDLALVWSQGDGEGGAVINLLIKTLRSRGHVAENRRYDAEHGLNVDKPKRKGAISAELRRLVFERDAYRCKHCGSHIDLTVDHIVPESKGGTFCESNLQTLCRPCNSIKGVNA